MIKVNSEEQRQGKLNLTNAIKLYGVNLVKCNALLKRDDVFFVNFEDEDGNEKDIYELYIMDEAGKTLFNELEYPTAYIEALGIYVVGITHYGISWDYVMTDIALDEYEGVIINE